MRSRGAITPDILQQISERWKPLVESQGLLTFTGRSVTSVVPVALRRGQVSSSVREALRAAFDEVTSWQPAVERPGGRDYQDAFFRVHEAVKGVRTNGGHWQRLAPKAISDFVARFLKLNRSFVDGVASYAASRPRHRHKGKQITVLESPGSVVENLFAFAALIRCSNGASDMWHCDGGPSMIFMAISVEGGRILQFEDAVGNLQSIELREGEVYVSSPSCFWHCVRPLGRKPSKTLVLRSSLLTRRYSGGRGGFAQADRGTSGYPMETKQAFEEAAKAVFGVMQKAPLRFAFDLG